MTDVPAAALTAEEEEWYRSFVDRPDIRSDIRVGFSRLLATLDKERTKRSAIYAPLVEERFRAGTRLVLMSHELMDKLAEPREGYRITWQWGEPDEHGWYNPTFTETPAEGLTMERLATLREAHAIGAISHAGDGFFAADAGYGYDDAEATMAAASAILEPRVTLDAAERQAAFVEAATGGLVIAFQRFVKDRYGETLGVGQLQAILEEARLLVR